MAKQYYNYKGILFLSLCILCLTAKSRMMGVGVAKIHSLPNQISILVKEIIKKEFQDCFLVFVFDSHQGNIELIKNIVHIENQKQVSTLSHQTF